MGFMVRWVAEVDGADVSGPPDRICAGDGPGAGC
jgi:hypothetical protein